MSLARFFRWVPTPTYGKCGGRRLDCSEAAPRDKMDELFEEHDQNLYQSSFLKTSDEIKAAREESDQILYTGLKRLDPKMLRMYGKIYRLISLIIFRPTS